ncbi:MAG: hypothetical protein K2R98_23450 [Gemmataceae bacterium]|nr:hypothetical protein [Gemmataceae bacterium]
MANLRSISKSLAGLVWVAVRSFVGTLLVLTLAGLVLAAASGVWLHEHIGWWSLLAGGIALTEAIAAGVFLGAKRAIFMALMHALRKLGLGRKVVQVVFARLLGVSADQDVGERGGTIAKTIERVPLAQAERKLTQTVNDLLNAPAEDAGWWRRKFQGILLRSVQKYTLARFRAEGAESGGVDLVKVQSELEDRIDDLILAKLRGGLNLWTLAVIIGLPLLVAAQTSIVYLLVHSR